MSRLCGPIIIAFIERSLWNRHIDRFADTWRWLSHSVGWWIYPFLLWPKVTSHLSHTIRTKIVHAPMAAVRHGLTFASIVVIDIWSWRMAWHEAPIRRAQLRENASYGRSFSVFTAHFVTFRKNTPHAVNGWFNGNNLCIAMSRCKAIILTARLFNDFWFHIGVQLFSIHDACKLRSGVSFSSI